LGEQAALGRLNLDDICTLVGQDGAARRSRYNDG
jgi:hypothetical protein